MGLILDSSLLIAAERRRMGLSTLLRALDRDGQDERIGVSVVTLSELNFGVYRAKSGLERDRRRDLVESLRREIPAFPVTAEIALLAGQVRAERTAAGFTLSFEDLAIGLTALSIGYGVVTLNIRHFELIPGLVLVSPPPELL